MAKNTTHELFMNEALKEAKRAYKKNEVPIGAVIEYKGKVFSRAHNKKIKNKTATAHAEILAIDKASKKLGDWRLEAMTIYVTCEPCLMCIGAIIEARIKKIVYACHEAKTGAVHSNYNVLNNKKRPIVRQGILEKEAKQILQNFFKDLRIKKSPLPK